MLRNRLRNPAFIVASPTAEFPVGDFTNGEATDIVQGWQYEQDSDGGTPPATAIDRLTFPLDFPLSVIPGEPSQYLSFDLTSQGSGVGSNAYQLFKTHKLGPRVLNGRQAIFSFWMNSTVKNREIVIQIKRSYGTGGTPSPDEIFVQTLVPLVDKWQRYASKVTILPIFDPLNPKVFGTNNDAYLECAIYFTAPTGFFTQLGDKHLLNMGGILQFAQPQLEQGGQATDFEDDVDPTDFEDLEIENTVFEYEIPLSTTTNVATVSGLALSFVPAAVECWVDVSNAGQYLTAGPLEGTITEDGFQFVTSGLPDGTQTLKFRVIYPNP